MAIKLEGKVFDSQTNKPLPKVDVIISDEKGNLALVNNDPRSTIGALTNDEGKYEINIDVKKINGINVPLSPGKYITARVKASEELGTTKKVTLPIDLSQSKTYDFDIKGAGNNREFKDVPVIGFKAKPEETQTDTNKKKSYWWVWVSLGLTAILGYTYYIKKGK